MISILASRRVLHYSPFPVAARRISTQPARTAIITGAGQGIGRAIALRLARDKFDICVNDLESNASRAESVVEEIRALGRRAVVAYGDVSQLKDVEAIVATSVSALGSLTAMVSNAGVSKAQDIFDVTEADLRRMWDINVTGTFLCDQVAAKQLVEQGTGGKIINAASIVSYMVDPKLAPYCASKAAVRSLTQSFAKALGPYKINVNAYAPGVVDTNMWDVIDEGMGSVNGMKKGDNFKAFGANILLGRSSVPEDPANVVSWLASKDSDYVTGQTIVVDGGMVFT